MDATTPGMAYTYDTNTGRLTGITVGSGGSQLVYAFSNFDGNGRPTTIDGPWSNDTVTLTYDALGRVTLVEQQLGDDLNYFYDTQGRLGEVRIGEVPGYNQRIFHYTYGGAGGANRLPDSVEYSVDTTHYGSTVYTYDGLYRLTSVTAYADDGTTVVTGNTFGFGDKSGMKTGETVTDGGAVTLTPGYETYVPNELNQYDSGTAGSYTYDADGNMTVGYTADGEQFTASYDAENRLVSLTSTSHSLAFTYGQDGFLVKQVVDGVETRFVRFLPSPGSFGFAQDRVRGWGRGSLVLQERDSSNNVTRTYAWNPEAPGGIGGLLQMTDGTGTYNYLYDGKGNVRAVFDPGTQTVVASYAYDEFGRLVSETGTLDQPYRFSTKRYYDGVGINYYGYRFYDANLGRWMTRDPLGEEGGLNLYGFVGNKPVHSVDYFGLVPRKYFSTFEKVVKDATIYAYSLLLMENVNFELYYTPVYPITRIDREYMWNYYYNPDKDKCKRFTYDEPQPGPLFRKISFPGFADPKLGKWIANGHIHGYVDGKNDVEHPSVEDYDSNTKDGQIAGTVPGTYQDMQAPGTIGTPSGNIIYYYYDPHERKWDYFVLGRWY